MNADNTICCLICLPAELQVRIIELLDCTADRINYCKVLDAGLGGFDWFEYLLPGLTDIIPIWFYSPGLSYCKCLPITTCECCYSHN